MFAPNQFEFAQCALQTHVHGNSQFVAYRDPPVVQVVASTEDLEVVAIGAQRFSDLVDLLRFLTLSSSLAEDNVGHVAHRPLFRLALDTNKASLLCVLQIEAVALRNPAIDGLLDPCDLVDEVVAKVLHHFDSISIFRVDDPNEKETIRLQPVKWNVFNLRVV